jgi:hypothetical protein
VASTDSFIPTPPRHFEVRDGINEAKRALDDAYRAFINANAERWQPGDARWFFEEAVRDMSFDIGGPA